MSQHDWFEEHIECHLAGGLDEAEQVRFDEHAEQCDRCAGKLKTAVDSDRRLHALFADVQLPHDQDDQIIGKLDAVMPHVAKRFSTLLKIAGMAASVLLLATVGGIVASNLESNAREDFRFGVDLSGGTVLVSSDTGTVESSEVFDADRLADLTHGSVQEKPNAPPGEPPMAEDPLLTTDIDPTALEPQRKDGFVSGLLPSGSFAPKDTVGIIDGLKIPPIDLPAPPGFQGKNDEWFQPTAENDKLKQLADQFAKNFEKTPSQSPNDPADELPGNKQPKKNSDALLQTAQKVIYTGEMQFEVDSFDGAINGIKQLVGDTKGAFIATINSDRLNNGKMRGSITLRIPPDKLYDFIAALQEAVGKSATLISQRLGSKDVTKQYTDLESRLRAARTMEERLLKIIKDGKGEIKDLILVEKELSVWRTKIEEFEGELRYYKNLVSLSTLTIEVTEREIQQAASVTEVERVQAGLEVDDVQKTIEAVSAAVTEKKGRVLKSELKQDGAGQAKAIFEFEVAPDDAKSILAQLRTLGEMVDLSVDRIQQAAGSKEVPRTARIKRGDTRFFLSIYNLANVKPRETVFLRLAAKDVAATYHKLRESVISLKGIVRDAQLDEKDKHNITGLLRFGIRRSEMPAWLTTMNKSCATLSRKATRVAAGANVTDAKVAFHVDLFSTAAISPRTTITIAMEVDDVKKSAAFVRSQVKEKEGRTTSPQFAQSKDGRVTAHFVCELPLAKAGDVVELIKTTGKLRVHNVKENPRSPEGILATTHIRVTLSNQAQLVPEDEGFWANIRHGLSLSLRGLSLSARYVIIGVLFVLPWVLLLIMIVWMVRRLLLRPSLSKQMGTDHETESNGKKGQQGKDAK